MSWVMLKDLDVNQPEIVRLKNSVNERDHAVDSKTAPVTLLEYGNFECIHCGRVYPVTLPNCADGTVKLTSDDGNWCCGIMQ